MIKLVEKGVTIILLAGCLATGAAYGQGWIVGGGDAQEGQFPWVADMRMQEMHLCGGALVAPQWVLTAAHCCVDGGTVISTEGLTFRFNTVGTYGPVNPNGGVSREASAIFVHPQFDINQLTNGHDIALVKLEQPVSSIAPIALPSLADTATVYATGYPVKIAGWGLSDTTDYFPQPNIMKFCSTKVFDRSLCAAIVGPLTQKAFCAGYKDGEEESGSAKGDSGGPVWIENGNEQKITGIVSGGVKSWTVADTPGIFTKVAAFRSWIDSVMQANGDNTPTGIPAHWTEEQIKVGADHNILHLYFGLIGVSEVVCDLYSIDGKKHYSTLIRQPAYRNYTLDLAGLPSGMYIVRIHHDAGGQYYTRKVLKN